MKEEKIPKPNKSFLYHGTNIKNLDDIQKYGLIPDFGDTVKGTEAYSYYMDDEFMDEYYKQHECCPKCGAEEHTSTLVGYVLDWDRKDEYKDMNRCECMECGDKHSAHDRVPSIEALM